MHSAGWDEGIVGMQPGGERLLIVPAKLGYGNKKMDGIPANSTLKFGMSLSHYVQNDFHIPFQQNASSLKPSKSKAFCQPQFLGPSAFEIYAFGFYSTCYLYINKINERQLGPFLLRCLRIFSHPVLLYS